jgi:deazaflavin-dependent oxidoreductase (nitroreductase family)
MTASFNQQVIEEFRTNAGRVGGMFEGAPLVLLHTAGAKTGRPRTNPAVYLADGDRILVFASNAGQPKNPDWYANLLADPRVTVEIGLDDGVETYAADAVPLDGEERDRFFRLQAERDPAFAAYQAGTTRTIPVIALKRLDLAADPARTRAIGEYLVRVHDELRGELATVRKEVDDFFGGRVAEVRLGKRLSTHCLAFCDALRVHHTREDGVFTEFEKQFPELRPALDRLRREHHVVAGTLTELQALLADLGVADGDRVRDEFERLASGLEEHFAYEEEQLLPALS